MIKIVFFDIDGTLLPFHSNVVPESTKNAIRQLHKKEIRTVIATGRYMDEIVTLPIMELDFDAFLTLNGQLILNRDQKRLFSTVITSQEIEFMTSYLQKKGVAFSLIGEKQRYIGNYDKYPAEIQKFIPKDFSGIDERYDEEIYQCTAMINSEMKAYLQETLKECKVVSWNESGVDVIPKSGGKAAGMKKLMTYLGIKPQESMAFGDADNDRDMLSYAAIGVAMGNADECVKEAADYVTTSASEDGIANALRHFGLIE